MTRELHSLDAERSVLGGILLENAALGEVLETALEARDFYLDRHARIFSAMRALAESNRPIDTIELRELVVSRGDLERVGGDEYMLGLTNTIHATANIVAHAKTVRALSAQRSIVTVCRSVIAEAGEGVEDVPAFVERASTAVRTACERVSFATGESLALHEAAHAAVRECLSDSPQQRLTLGLACLDANLGGIEPGNMVVIGADTGVGKSSLVLRMAMGMAPFFPVGIVSCEDAKGIWGSRAAGAWSGVSPLRMRSGASTADRDALSRLDQSMPAPSIHLEIQIGAPVGDVCAAMRRLVRLGARVLFVDYVQTIKSEHPTAPRKDQVRDIAATLKGQAAALGVSLVLVSQLARPHADDKSREPSIHHLKETGDLENAAEVILLLWNADPNDPDSIAMKIGKSKWGARRRLFKLERTSAGVLEESAITTSATDERRPYAD